MHTPRLLSGWQRAPGKTRRYVSPQGVEVSTRTYQTIARRERLGFEGTREQFAERRRQQGVSYDRERYDTMVRAWAAARGMTYRQAEQHPEFRRAWKALNTPIQSREQWEEVMRLLDMFDPLVSDWGWGFVYQKERHNFEMRFAAGAFRVA